MRWWMAALVVGAQLVVGTMVGPDAAAAAEVTTLREAAAARGLQVGSAVSASALEADPAYRDRVAAEFNTVTTENEFKWSVLEPVRGRYDFSRADRIVDFAAAHHQAVRGHTLVWHSSLPEWLTTGTFSQAELRDILRNHVQTVVSRYRGRVAVWDVVNEPLAEDGTPRDGFWLSRLGPGYLADAFHWARAVDPAAQLYLNEYGTETNAAKARGLHELVRDLRARGVPVDGVGFQTHKLLTSRLSALGDVLRRFADLGLDVAITELDVRVPVPADATELAQQAEVYAWAAQACLAVPRCRSITTWGFTDARSWIPAQYPGWGAATLLDESLAAKPAYRRLLAVLRDWQRPGTGPVAWWRLDDWGGTTASDASGSGHSAVVSGTTLGWYERQPTTFALRGDGVGTGAVTAGPVIDTARSYAVSAWVSLTSKTARRVVASQDGTARSAFTLSYEPSTDRWVFAVPLADSAQADVRTVSSTSVPTVNRWTHLTAVWNAGWGRMQLYVDGVLEMTAPPGGQPPATGWTGRGPFRLGRSSAGEAFAGGISDVRVFARVVDAAEAAALADTAVGSWTFDGHTGDESWFSRDGFPRPEQVGFTADRAGRPARALLLTGTEVIDVRGGMTLWTDRSYTVTAWVRLADANRDGRPDGAGDQVVASQDGRERGTFQLQYESDDGRWAYKVPVTDSGPTGWPTVESLAPAVAGRWTHLAAVWNAGWGRFQLYVDGVLQGTSAATTSSPATGGLHVGVSMTGGRLTGALDDVQVHQRALQPAEITALATP